MSFGNQYAPDPYRCGVGPIIAPQVDIGLLAVFLTYLANLVGCSIFAYDYSGYGMSSGRPTERNLYADIQAAVSCVNER